MNRRNIQDSMIANRKPTKTTMTVKASPAATKLAIEAGVDLSKIKGTGKDGAITVTNVRAYLEAKKS